MRDEYEVGFLYDRNRNEEITKNDKDFNLYLRSWLNKQFKYWFGYATSVSQKIVQGHN